VFDVLFIEKKDGNIQNVMTHFKLISLILFTL